MISLLIYIASLGQTTSPHSPDLLIDSQMTRQQALGKNHFPRDVLENMAVVTVTYNGFDHRIHQGQIVVRRSLAAEVKQIFDEIRATGYPIKKVVPIVAYGWSDVASIRDNNTSAFNFREVLIPGRVTHRLSHHSYGIAIDLNPKINPFVGPNGEHAVDYDPSRLGTLTKNSKVTQIFLHHGWKWGGLWKNGQDYQHFEKSNP